MRRVPELQRFFGCPVYEDEAVEGFVPLSVRYGSRRRRFQWWLSGLRERIALRLAPWLDRAEEDRAIADWALREIGNSGRQPTGGVLSYTVTNRGWSDGSQPDSTPD